MFRNNAFGDKTVTSSDRAKRSLGRHDMKEILQNLNTDEKVGVALTENE